MSIIIQEILKRNAAEIAANVVDAIKNKPITRYTKSKGKFSSVVNASGRLASSVRYTTDENGFKIYAYDYIDALIYGRKPTSGGGDGAVLRAIREWVGTPKMSGSELNPYAVASNIHKYGTSIWQEHHGKDSGLLANAINESVISRIRTELATAYVKELVGQITLRQAA